jgi:hypothetical protein
MNDVLQRWEWAARTTLADREIGYWAASEILAHVRDYCLSSGHSPWDAFGSPHVWASAVAVPAGAAPRHAARH